MNKILNNQSKYSKTGSNVHRHNISCTTFIILLCLALIACSNNVGYSGNQNITLGDTLKFTGCQEIIKAEVGTVIELKLEAVQATGYAWILKDSTTFTKLNQTDDLIYSRSDGQDFQVLHLETIKKGFEEVTLEYRRTFEKGIEKSCTIKIEIN